MKHFSNQVMFTINHSAKWIILKQNFAFEFYANLRKKTVWVTKFYDKNLQYFLPLKNLTLEVTPLIKSKNQLTSKRTNTRAMEPFSRRR